MSRRLIVEERKGAFLKVPQYIIKLSKEIN